MQTSAQEKNKTGKKGRENEVFLRYDDERVKILKNRKNRPKND